VSGPLAVRSFRLLAGGQFASTIGDYCYAVALPWLVLSEHGGAIRRTPFESSTSTVISRAS
jgi:hypothetical protein